MGIGIWHDYKEWPVSEWDDYMIHQVTAPMEEAGISDPLFMERLIFCAQNAEGTLHLMAGAGSTPNAGLMDGFVCMRHKDVQRNIRISRHLQNDRANMEIGLLSYKVIEPLKRWGIYLADNDYGIGCSLEFRGRVAPWSHPVASREQRISGPGELITMHAHFDQPGYVNGTITFEGQQFNADDFICIRDRTWAVRLPVFFQITEVYFWIQAQFSDFSMCVFYYDGGEKMRLGGGAFLGDDGSVIDIVDIRHRIHFMPTARDYTKMEFVLVDANGKERHLTATPISPQSYMAGGGYDDRFGIDNGPLHIEGERWIVSPPLGIEDHRFGMNQRVIQFELDGESGPGLIECGFNREPNWQYKPTL